MDGPLKKYSSMLALIVIGAIAFYLHQVKIYEDEKDFAHFGLIREGAIYTLLGDKPISDFGAISRKKERLEPHDLQKVTVVDVSSSKLTFTKNDFYKKELIDLWSKWKKRHSISNNKFAFVCIGEELDGDLYLVNKLSVKDILNRYYFLFTKSLGREFNVNTVIEQIDDPKSLFWTHMVNCDYGHICMGLLYGFGLENTMKFEKRSISDSFETGYLLDEPEGVLLNLGFTKEVSVNDLLLPHYRLFFDPDPVLEHYKKERARIQKEYKDADLRQLLIDALKN